MNSKQKIYKANTVSVVELLKKLDEPIKKVGKNIRWLRHDSVSINGNLWYQHSMKRGGLPIDFLTTFFDYPKDDAIAFILNEFHLTDVSTNKFRSNVTLKFPKVNCSTRIVETYLNQFRFINNSVIEEFIKLELIYEERNYQNCLFVGKDFIGSIKHIHRHSTHISNKDIKHNLDGSDGKYSFNWIGNSNVLYIFESPIDLLSYITLYPENWKHNSYVSLCGLSPSAINRIVDEYSSIDYIVLCLDNDLKGQESTIQIYNELKEYQNLEVSVHYPRFKDFNEDLKYLNDQPVIEGIREPYLQVLDNSLQQVIQLSKNEKDKTLKDLMNSISIVYYGQKFNEPKQIKKHRNALLESSRNALMLARQQYRHFEKHFSIEEMIYLLKDDTEPIMNYSAIDENYSGITKDLNSIKTLFTTKIFYTEDDKNELINSLLSLAKRCIHTHVFLTLNERK